MLKLDGGGVNFFDSLYLKRETLENCNIWRLCMVLKGEGKFWKVFFLSSAAGLPKKVLYQKLISWAIWAPESTQDSFFKTLPSVWFKIKITIFENPYVSTEKVTLRRLPCTLQRNGKDFWDPIRDAAHISGRGFRDRNM